MIPKTGKELREARKTLGLSQSQLALLLGVAPQTVYKMEKRAEISAKYGNVVAKELAKLANALAVKRQRVSVYDHAQDRWVTRWQ